MASEILANTGAEPLFGPMLTNCQLDAAEVQWNLNHNATIFIYENAVEYVGCELSAILFRPQC